MEIRKAQRQKAKLRMGLVAPSGAGKTYSALKLAFGLGGKIGLIDTEHGSGELYADLGDYDVIQIGAPYSVQKYLDALKAFEQAGYDTVIIDSLSHAWAGEGGLLDKQGKIADRGTNSFAAWRTVTPEHNSLVQAMLASPCHIVATMRAKTEYVLEVNEKGKQTPRKVGMAPVQRDGMEYEFTVVFDIDAQHVASTSKDRTRLFDGQFFKITEDTGAQLKQWLESGADARKQEPSESAQPAAKPASSGAAAKIEWEKAPESKRITINEYVVSLGEFTEKENYDSAFNRLEGFNLDNEDKVLLWSQLDSKTRSAFKRISETRGAA